MTISKRIREIREGFLPAFWIANTLELFERLAFYSTTAVLAVFLRDVVGLEKDASSFAGLFSGLIYTLPILAGVLVDRYGFRKTLMACFAIFSVGYFLIGFAGLGAGQELIETFGKRAYILSVLIFTAIGGSLIKPCIVGTVAKTSTEQSRGFGFAIYYTLVNFGGAIGPLIAAEVRHDFGIESVLFMSSITSALLFFGTLLFFNDPVTSGDPIEQRTFTQVFKDMILVFRNVKFITFLVIFSGFWIMFWQIFLSFPFYILEVLKYEKFEHLETVDAICIIFLTIPISALVKKMKPIKAMTIGFIFASVSWSIIGFYNTIWASIVGIAVYAIGEATQSPRFYEYISFIAPKESVGTYMGFAFLPVAIGSFAGGPIADWLVNSYLKTNPSMMWYIVAMIGLVSTLLMVLYNFLITKQST